MYKMILLLAAVMSLTACDNTPRTEETVNYYVSDQDFNNAIVIDEPDSGFVNTTTTNAK